MKRRWLTLCALALATPAAADNELTITRDSAPVADQVNTLTPARNLPGSTIDNTVTVVNPLVIGKGTIATVKIVDKIPFKLKLRVADLVGTSGGPVEFVNGNLLGITFLPSGLTYSYGGLGDGNDGLEFSTDGTNFGYTPVDQGDGYDGAVRAIRVTLKTTTNFAQASSFRLRYRVMLK